MAQHDYVIDNSTGANVRADINNALLAISSTNSGSSAPSTTYAFQLFANTTTSKLQIRNAANSAFVDLIGLDGSILLPDGSVSSPSLAFSDDLNTGIFSSAADTLNFTTGGVERMELGTATVFNEDGADVDFRIEGDTEANLFYVDAGNDRIGIGTSSPAAPFHVAHSGTSTSVGSNFISLRSGASGRDIGIQFADGATTAYVGMLAGAIYFADSGSNEKARFDSSGRLLLGTTTEGASGADQFTIAGSGNTGLTIRAGTASDTNIFFSDGTSGDDEFRGVIRYQQNVNQFEFFTDATRHLIIDNIGRLIVGTVTVGNESGDELTLNSSGNTGITLRSPSSNNCSILFADGTSGTDNFSGFLQYQHGSDAMVFATSSSERLRIDSSGNVGIGTSSPSSFDSFANLLVVGTTSGNNGITIVAGSSNSSSIYFADGTSGGSQKNAGIVDYNHSTDTMRFATAADNAMIIDSSRRVLINTTSTLASEGFLQVACNSNTDGVQFHCTDNSSTNILEMKHGSATGSDTGFMIAFRRADGTMVGSIVSSTSATAYNTSSDYRLKENVTAISDGITRLKTLKPYKFNFIGDSKIIDGFLAHEVTAVPEAITGTKDEVDSDNKPVYQGIDQSKLVPLLVAAVQELIGKVEALEAA